MRSLERQRICLGALHELIDSDAELRAESLASSFVPLAYLKRVIVLPEA